MEVDHVWQLYLNFEEKDAGYVALFSSLELSFSLGSLEIHGSFGGSGKTMAFG